MINEVIDEMYHKKEYAKLRDYLREMEPADVAELLTNAELEEDELIIMFRILPKELAADVFVEMEPEEQEDEDAFHIRMLLLLSSRSTAARSALT